MRSAGGDVARVVQTFDEAETEVSLMKKILSALLSNGREIDIGDRYLDDPAKPRPFGVLSPVCFDLRLSSLLDERFSTHPSTITTTNLRFWRRNHTPKLVDFT